MIRTLCSLLWLVLVLSSACSGTATPAGDDTAGDALAPSDTSAYAPRDLLGDAALDVARPADVVVQDVPAPRDTGRDLAGTPSDRDGDGIGNAVDNCPDVANRDQQDDDRDGTGNACDPDYVGPPPPGDADGDDVPDAADRWPSDPTMPGIVRAQAVYMHTSSTLFLMEVKTFVVTELGAFGWPSDGRDHQMTDIAIDRHGVLYGITFDGVYSCHPESTACTSIGALPTSFNALSFVPGSAFGETNDVLIGVSGAGDWYRLDLATDPVTTRLLGSYGNYCSSGDVYSAAGVGTFASVKQGCAGEDLLVRVDPATGRVLSEVGALGGYSSVWGMAGWARKAYAFDATGDIVVVDVETGVIEATLRETDEEWWGAGTITWFPAE